jgi:very-short-patch-repair endonuclease
MSRFDVLRDGPFRGRDAIAAGLLTPDRLRSKRWRREFHGIYVDSSIPESHLGRVEAAALILPAGAVVTGRSAAVLWGVGIDPGERPVEIATPTRMRRVPGAAVRTERVPAHERTEHRGIPVHVPAHVAYAIARDLPPPEAVGWIDALMRRRGMTVEDLDAHLGPHMGDAMWRRAARTLRRCDPRAESPRESELRLHLSDAGIAPLVPQFEVRDERGEFVARLDLAVPDCRLGIEYDGLWHADREQLARDRRRLRALTAAGWELYPSPTRTYPTSPP